MSQFQEIREILKELALSQAQTDKQLKETDKQLKETDKQLKETDKQLEETDKQLKELALAQAQTDKQLENLIISQAKIEKENEKGFRELRETQDRSERKLNKIAKLFGESERNKGFIIEDFFYNSLLENKTLNNIKYDSIIKNLELKISKNQKREIDLVLLNGSHIALLEIKTKANIKDFEKIDKVIESYKKIYPYEKRKIFIFYGSFCFDKSIKENAKEKGYGLLSLKNNVIQIENTNIKEFSLK